MIYQDYLIAIVIVIVLVILIKLIFFREYKFGEAEEKELDYISQLKGINDSQHLLGQSDDESYRSINKELVRMVDEVERKYRYDIFGRNRKDVQLFNQRRTRTSNKRNV